MTNNDIRLTVAQMLRDWNSMTPPQRQQALEAAAQKAGAQ